MERWNFETEQAKVAYTHDKVDQLNAMDEYVSSNGYTCPNINYYLNQGDVRHIRDNAKFHLINELKGVGVIINIYDKPKDETL